MRRAIPHAMFTIPLCIAGCAGPPSADASSPVPRARIKALNSDKPIDDRWLAAALNADDPAVRRAAERRMAREQQGSAAP